MNTSCLGVTSARMLRFSLWTLFAAATFVLSAQETSPTEILLRNVRVLDVVNGRLGTATNVLIRGNTIAAIGPAANAGAGARIIDGEGRTLLPGLIDAHVHLTFGSMLLSDLTSINTTPEKAAAAAATSAAQMLQRGFHRGSRRRRPHLSVEARHRQR